MDTARLRVQGYVHPEDAPLRVGMLVVSDELSPSRLEEVLGKHRCNATPALPPSELTDEELRDYIAVLERVRGIR